MLKSRLVPAVAGVVVLMVLVLGAWWWLTPASEPEVAAVSELESAAPEEAEATPATPEEAGAVPEETAAPQAEPEPEVAEEDAAPEAEPETAEASARWEPDPADESAATVPDDEIALEPGTPEATARWEPDDEPEAAEGEAATEDEPESETAEVAARWEPDADEGGDAQGASEEELTAQLTPGVGSAPAEVESPECPSDGAAPGCALAADALRVMAATPAPAPAVNLNQPDGIWVDQEYLVIEMQLPEELGGYVYVDVLTDAGSVYHLLPEPLRPDNQLPPGGVMRVGVEADERQEGVRHWQVSEPFGEAYLMVLVSEEPIYEELRPIAEPLESYRDVLLEALADPDSGDKSVYLRQIEFRPG